MSSCREPQTDVCVVLVEKGNTGGGDLKRNGHIAPVVVLVSQGVGLVNRGVSVGKELASVVKGGAWAETAVLGRSRQSGRRS